MPARTLEGVGGPVGVLRRRATSAVALLLAVLAVVLLAGPPASAGASRPDERQEAVATVAVASPDTAETQDRLHPLLPLRHALAKATAVRHRGGALPVPAVVACGAAFLLPSLAVTRLPRVTCPTSTLPRRSVLTYPMRT